MFTENSVRIDLVTESESSNVSDDGSDIRNLHAGRAMTAGRYADGWSFLLFLGFLRGRDSRSSGLSMPAIMPVATRV